MALAVGHVGLDALDAALGQKPAGRASRPIDWSRFRAISGIWTFSSKLPWRPPTAMAASLPITWAATWQATSG